MNTLFHHIWLQDEDPYVRKTAAICVVKLFDINPEMVDDRGFLDTLRVGLSSLWEPLHDFKQGCYHHVSQGSR